MMHGRIDNLEPDRFIYTGEYFMGLDELYKQAHSESHEAGLNAVYNQGFKDGIQGSSALVETLQAEIAALKQPQAPVPPPPSTAPSIADQIALTQSSPAPQGDASAQTQA
jgi:hypothetical protein